MTDAEVLQQYAGLPAMTVTANPIFFMILAAGLTDLIEDTPECPPWMCAGAKLLIAEVQAKLLAIAPDLLKEGKTR